LENVFNDQINEPKKKDNDGEAVDPMHDRQVYVSLGGWIPFFEKVGKNFPEVPVSCLFVLAFRVHAFVFYL